MGQPLDGPHLVLVQRVAGGVRVAGGRAGQPVGGHRAACTGAPGRPASRPSSGTLAGHHRVEHLRRQQQRHRRAARLVGLDVGVEGLVEQVAVDPAQLAEVLHAVDALPLGAAPLLLGHVGEAGQPAPVGLDERACRVLVGLFEHGASRLVAVRIVRNTGDLTGGSSAERRRHARFFCIGRVRRERQACTDGRTRPRGAPGARAGRGAAPGGPAARRRPGDRPPTRCASRSSG